MIQSEVGFQQSLEIIADMYKSLAELHQRVAPLNSRNYQILAEGPVEEIRRAQQDINEYLGVTEQFAAETDSAVPSPAIAPSSDSIVPDHLSARNRQ